MNKTGALICAGVNFVTIAACGLVLMQTWNNRPQPMPVPQLFEIVANTELPPPPPPPKPCPKKPKPKPVVQQPAAAPAPVAAPAPAPEPAKKPGILDLSGKSNGGITL